LIEYYCLRSGGGRTSQGNSVTITATGTGTPTMRAVTVHHICNM